MSAWQFPNRILPGVFLFPTKRRNIVKRIFQVLIIVLVLAIPTVAFAQGLAQDATPAATQSVGEIVLDMAFVVTITAFLKNLFSVSGKPVMAIAFGVGVVIWAVPLIVAAFPAFGGYVESFFMFLKAWLAAMGSVDLVNDVGSNIASVKATKTVIEG